MSRNQVKDVYEVAGDYDIIAHINARSIRDLNDIVEPFDWSKREKAMWKWAHTTWSIEEFADPELIDSYIQRAKDKGYL